MASPACDCIKGKSAQEGPGHSNAMPFGVCLLLEEMDPGRSRSLSV